MSKNPNVETYKGEKPKCLYCSKDLKPNYETKIEHAHKLVKCEEQTNHNALCEHYGCAQNSAGVWLYSKGVNKVASRKFLGTFGAYGFFCNMTVCAANYAIACARSGIRLVKKAS